MESEASTLPLLVVDDDRKLATSVSRNLEGKGYRVVAMFDGLEAKRYLESNEVGLLLLDLQLPHMGGIELLMWLRDLRKSLPVIVISASSATAERVRCLDVGADDYLVKPFDSSELAARVAAVLRRTGTAEATVLTCGDIRMRVSDHIVTRGEERINLSQREFALLEFLLRNKNQIVTRQRVLQQVWGYDFATETNIVDVYISYLRRAIDAGTGKKRIHTIHGEGFLLSDDRDSG
jgi:DNA-binding response OmpR family regulator